MDDSEFQSLPTTKPRRREASGRIDRLPPNDQNVEAGTLSCILLDPERCMPICIERLRSGDKEFYDLRHQTIYSAMVKLYDERTGIDVITLQSELNTRKKLEEIGGIAYLSSLPEVAPSAANLEYYLETLRATYLRRLMINVCTEAIQACYESELAVNDLMDLVETNILKAGEQRVVSNERSMKTLVNSAINDIEAIWKRKGNLVGLDTGFPDLNYWTGGFEPGTMNVIAARPSMGKTALIMNIMEFISVQLGLPVGVFSLEMTAEQLTQRMLLSRARVNIRNVRQGFLAERDFPKITGAAGKLASAPIYMDDTPSMSVLELRARARRMFQRYGIKAIGIDYLQLLNNSGSGQKFESTRLELTQVSHAIKALAKELSIPIIVAAQLNRDIEKEARKPRMSDLGETGAIEQDADIIGFLYYSIPREEAESPEFDAVPVNLLLAKQRNGPRGVDVPLTFMKSYTRFESAAKVSDGDVPKDYEQREISYDEEK